MERKQMAAGNSFWIEMIVSYVNTIIKEISYIQN